MVKEGLSVSFGVQSMHLTSLELKPFACMKKQLGRGTAWKGMTVQESL